MDEEEFASSDSSDDDYVPGEALSEGEEESGDEEDLSVLNKEATTNAKRRTQKASKKDTGPPKRKGGIKLAEEEEEKKEDKDDYNKQLHEEIKIEQQEKKQEEEKKKVDDLWAMFKADVGQPIVKPKASSSGLGALSSKAKPISSSSTGRKVTAVSSPSSSSPASSTSSPASSKTVTITKEYDFAGEIVKVTKEVAASSKEAQVELKKQENGETAPQEKRDIGKLPSGLGAKRPAGGLGSVLGFINKKSKMSTLEKSRLDWNTFKSQEGISEELAIHNRGKEGYIEKKQFLERADLRQFEIEKNIRMSTSKR